MEMFNTEFRTQHRQSLNHQLFTFIVPVLVAINVPARFMAMPLRDDLWPLAAFAIVAALGSLWVCRQVFRLSLRSYRSASS